MFSSTDTKHWLTGESRLLISVAWNVWASAARASEAGLRCCSSAELRSSSTRVSVQQPCGLQALWPRSLGANCMPRSQNSWSVAVSWVCILKQSSTLALEPCSKYMQLFKEISVDQIKATKIILHHQAATQLWQPFTESLKQFFFFFFFFSLIIVIECSVTCLPLFWTFMQASSRSYMCLCQNNFKTSETFHFQVCQVVDLDFDKIQEFRWDLAVLCGNVLSFITVKAGEEVCPSTPWSSDLCSKVFWWTFSSKATSPKSGSVESIFFIPSFNCVTKTPSLGEMLLMPGRTALGNRHNLE